MSYVMPLAFGAGYLGGGALSYLAGRRIVRAARRGAAPRELRAFLARVGGGVAFVPAALLGTVIGGNLGAAYLGAASAALGLGYAGVPVGLACGIALVTTIFTCIGVLLGAGVGRLLERPAAQRPPG